MLKMSHDPEELAYRFLYPEGDCDWMRRQELRMRSCRLNLFDPRVSEALEEYNHLKKLLPVLPQPDNDSVTTLDVLWPHRENHLRGFGIGAKGTLSVVDCMAKVNRDGSLNTNVREVSHPGITRLHIRKFLEAGGSMEEDIAGVLFSHLHRYANEGTMKLSVLLPESGTGVLCVSWNGLESLTLEWPLDAICGMLQTTELQAEL